MAKLESNLKKKIRQMQEEYSDRIFNSSCDGNWNDVKIWIEAKKVCDVIDKICSDRKRY